MKRKSKEKLEYIDKNGFKYVTKIATKSPGSCSNCDFREYLIRGFNFILCDNSIVFKFV